MSTASHVSQSSRGDASSTGRALTLGYLYPEQLSMLGDWGNIIALRQRCAWRGIALRAVALGMGDVLAPDVYDLLFIGGQQDKAQDEVAADLRQTKSSGLWAAIEDDVPALAMCGGYQLLSRSYWAGDGRSVQGIGVFDAETVPRGKRRSARAGNIAMRWAESTIIGFEDHTGRTFLGAGAKPFGHVLVGQGNNGEDKTEGCIYRNAYGTYLHGALLPTNPHLADHLLVLALKRRYGPLATLEPLDDSLEWAAHNSMLRRLGVSPQPRAGHSAARPVIR